MRNRRAERREERQHKQEQGYYQQDLWKAPRVTIWQHILGHLNAFFTRPDTSKQQCNMPIPLEMAVFEEERLSQNGFTDEEIVALFGLRQWYQLGGREHIVMLRHWEFLKMLVSTGRLEA
ncbi:MAG TPA: hypothetical protein VF026_05135 [Ktedonobacteraceae bacterium]